MSTKRRLAWLGAAVLVVGGLAGGVAYAARSADDDSPSEARSEQAFMAANLAQAAVGQEEAEAAALAARPGTVLESELEQGAGGLIWEVEIGDGTSIHEVVVDAQSGQVLGTEAEGSEGSEASEEESE